LYCFIEFCNGGSLKDLIKQKISELKIMTLLKQFLEAMTYINKMSNFECIVDKVHRDLKPDNVLLDEN
jgi:serine/threonine protein kinase